MIDSGIEIKKIKNRVILNVTMNIETEEDLLAFMKMIIAYDEAQQKNSVLSLVELNEMPISDKSAIILKKVFAKTEPYTKKTAVIPNDTYLRAFVMEINKSRDKKFKIFKDKEEALNWLTTKDPEDIDEFTTII